MRHLKKILSIFAEKNVGIKLVQRIVRFGQPILLIFLLNKAGFISQPLWIVILKNSLLGI